MQKWFIYLLSTYLLIVAPSLIQAEELDQPVDPSTLLNENISAFSSAHQKNATNQPDFPINLHKLQLLFDEFGTAIKNDSKLTPPSPEVLSTSNEGIQAVDNNWNPDVITQLPIELGPSLSEEIDVSIERTDLQETNFSDGNPVELVQGESENASTTNAGITSTEDKTINPHLSVDSLGLSINLLGENSDYQQQPEGDESLLKIDLGLNGVGNVRVDLISGNKVESESGGIQSTKGGLLGLVVTDSILLGDVNVDVLSAQTVTSNDGEVISGGLATVDLDNLLGQTHLGVIEYQQKVTEEGNTSTGGLVIIDLKDSPLGDVQLGVSEFEKIENSTDPKANSNSDDDTISGKAPIHVDPIRDEHAGAVGSIFPSLPKDEKSAAITKPNTNSGEQLKQSIPVVTFTEKDNKDSTADFIQKLKDSGNKTVLKPQTETKRSELNNIINSVNEKTNYSTGLPSSSASSTSSGGSAGPTNLGGGSGMAAYLTFGYLDDASLINQIQVGLKDFSNQWIKAPPIGPPKGSFFLSA